MHQATSDGSPATSSSPRKRNCMRAASVVRCSLRISQSFSQSNLRRWIPIWREKCESMERLKVADTLPADCLLLWPDPCGEGPYLQEAEAFVEMDSGAIFAGNGQRQFTEL